MISRVLRAVAAASVAFSTRIALACPLCAENMSKDPYGNQPTQLGRGFFWSIMLMIAVPFATVAFVAVRLFLARRREQPTEGKVPLAPEATS